MDYSLGNEADIGLSSHLRYSLNNAGFANAAIQNVRFFGEMCVFELKTWGHRIFVFKSGMGILRRAKTGARALKHNDLGPSQGMKLFAVLDGVQKANFSQRNACPATGKWPDKRCRVTRFAFCVPEGPKENMRRCW